MKKYRVHYVILNDENEYYADITAMSVERAEEMFQLDNPEAIITVTEKRVA